LASSGHPIPDSVPATLTRGAAIGRYIVLALVGRGGMGEVYAAYDPELDRKVAVKLLRVKPGNGVSLAEGRHRTLREAQAIARLSHSNVVVVYDVGTFEDKVFIAMEYVEGNTVTYWLQARQRSWQEILKVFIAAGNGLAAAHEKGLVHRDFKTDNVMIDRVGQVRVMDFGLARQAEKSGGPTDAAARPSPAFALKVVSSTIKTQRPDDPETKTLTLRPESEAAPRPLEGPSTSGMFEARLTRTGAMMGTPAYMAPEQFLGTPTDARSDQFSFCIALYEALYGERPFEGNTMSTLTANVVQGNVRDAPANSKVPQWLRRVLLRGLKPRAKDRWASMEDLIVALGKNPTLSRRRWALALGGAAILVGLVAGGRQFVVDRRAVCGGGPEKLVGIWDLPQQGLPPPARHEQIRRAFIQTGKSYAPDVFVTVSHALTTYAQHWADMHKDACEATIRGEQSAEVLDLRMSCLQDRLRGIRALTEVFAEANQEVVENAVSAANSVEPLDRCANVPLLRAVVMPPEDPIVRARVDELSRRLAALKARFDAGQWKDAAKEGPQLVSDAAATGYKPLIAETLAQEGAMLIRSNDSAAAEKTLTEAFWAADAARHDELRAAVAADLVYVVGSLQRRFDDGQRWARTSEAILERMGGHELLQAWLLNDLGTVFEAQGRQQAAVEAQQKGLALKERALGRDHPDVGISEGNLAVALQSLGRNAESLKHVDRAISLLEKGLGSGHPLLAVQLNNRGEVLNSLGRPREARSSFERARTIWEREVGPDNRFLAYALTGIGVSFIAEDSPANALVPLEQAFKIRKSQEPDQAKRAETSFALAKALWESNRDRGRARVLAEQARAAYAVLGIHSSAGDVDSWVRARVKI
jgi:eukaryotic-like serine/threonine-protein kinase